MSLLSDLPRHRGWTVDRVVPLAAGSVVLAGLALGRRVDPRWRALSAFAAANLVMYGTVGWCPASLAMGAAGLPRKIDPA